MITAILATACAARAQSASANLANQLKLLKANVVRMFSSTAQFLQGGGRWFPAPQGNDQVLCQQLKQLQDGADQMRVDLQNGESQKTLQYDMQQLLDARANLEQALPKVGGNREVAQDWGLVKGGVDSVAASYKTFCQGAPQDQGESEAKPPTVAECLQALSTQTQQFRDSLGIFVNAPGRVPPPHEEDLTLVQLLGQFQRQCLKLRNDVEARREDPFLRDDLDQLRYTSTRMDPLTRIIGSPPDTLQSWDAIRATLDVMNEIVPGGAPGSEMRADPSTQRRFSPAPPPVAQPSRSPAPSSSSQDSGSGF